MTKPFQYCPSIIVELIKNTFLNLIFKEPSSLFLTAGRELASQIFEVADQICSEVGIEARLELGGSTE